MPNKSIYFSGLMNYFEETGKVTLFAIRFFKEAFKPPYEWKELIRQCYLIGYQSLVLVAITGFIMGLVLDLQTRPTMIEFGAESYMPSMIGISIVREIGPVITALICAGKIGSGIGAELGSMRVTEQIDAMEVSGTNPFKFLVVTRIWATTLMLPILVIMADAVGLFGSWIVENLKGDVTFALFFNQVFNNIEFGDLIPSTIKSFFFGFAIGLIGCYKGYYTSKGTAGVGAAANTAVVVASLLLFVFDLIAVLITDIFYEI
ncbi:MAG: ABC transporter permease [Bacteroidetes bacterium]|jgi:phospholipid/cholesterol/gamma-HCH transport system permease protein|nr:ABC transporter permease [Bacteroidota bacterium]MDF1863884.1 ABC transporter permease [Saprospiraceae bacterium]